MMHYANKIDAAFGFARLDPVLALCLILGLLCIVALFAACVGIVKAGRRIQAIEEPEFYDWRPRRLDVEERARRGQ